MSATPRPAHPSPLASAARTVARMTAPLSRPLAGRRFFPLWAVVRHRGRRSGRSYAVPVAVRVSSDAFIIPVPWGEQTQWLQNIMAADGCSIRWRGADHFATAPRVIGFEAAADAFHPIQRAFLRAAGIRTFVRLERTPPGVAV